MTAIFNPMDLNYRIAVVHATGKFPATTLMLDAILAGHLTLSGDLIDDIKLCDQWLRNYNERQQAFAV